MARVLITGANRGIGLEFCRQLAACGDEVVATCRKASPALQELGVRVLEGVDVTDDAAVSAMARELGDAALDRLVLNAGVLTREAFGEVDFDGMRRQYEVNTLGPLRVAQALAGNLGAGSQVAILTSLMGSMSDNGSGGYYGYRASKAAVNAVGVSLARDLQPRGVAVYLLHPGMVATEMTGGRGISVDESVSGLLARLDALGIEETGTFWHTDGRELPW